VKCVNNSGYLVDCVGYFLRTEVLIGHVILLSLSYYAFRRTLLLFISYTTISWLILLKICYLHATRPEEDRLTLLRFFAPPFQVCQRRIAHYSLSYLIRLRASWICSTSHVWSTFNLCFEVAVLLLCKELSSLVASRGIFLF
jgi:hypothetical protein